MTTNTTEITPRNAATTRDIVRAMKTNLSYLIRAAAGGAKPR